MTPDTVINSPAIATLDRVSFFYPVSARRQQDVPSAIIDDLSVALMPGRITALIGPNAAGKTTLLRLMLGELQPTSGRVILISQNPSNQSGQSDPSDKLHHQDIARMAPADRAAQISYVPQRGLSSFAFTVEQVVRLGRYAVGPDDQAVARAIALTDLEKLHDRVYQELSVGQQQRVLLARAIAQCGDSGKLMLLDEPGSAMDLWHVHRLMRTLGELARNGLAVLVAVHDLNLAMRYADDVWLMNEGRLVRCGPWHAVMDPVVLESVYHMPMRMIHADADAEHSIDTRVDGAVGDGIDHATHKKSSRPVLVVCA